MPYTTPPTFTAGQVVTEAEMDILSDDIAHLGTRHGARVRSTSSLTVPNTTLTVAPFDTDDIDTDSYHSTSTNTSRLTIAAGMAGVYAGEGYFRFDATAVAGPIVFILKNGTPIRRGTPTALAYLSVTVPFTTWLDVGDYIELGVYHTHGSSQTFAAVTATTTLDPLSPVLEMWLVGGVTT